MQMIYNYHLSTAGISLKQFVPLYKAPKDDQ